MSWGFQYRKYVPVAKKKAQGRAYASKVAKRQGRDVQPVSIQGTKIAKTFWGKAWCDHLESYSDFANRLPRGRTYVRNGSVVDLQISTGRLKAIVAGSDPYDVTVEIARLKQDRWKKIQNACAASIDSLLDLLGGRLSDGVMQRLTDRSSGLFPAPAEIDMSCSCLDWAGVCKHIAAVLYGVGAHLDRHPELLFQLRGVDHHELVSEAASDGNLSAAFGEPSTDLADEDLGAMFGIELDREPSPPPAKRSPKKTKPSTKKPTRKRNNTAKSSPKKVKKATKAVKAVKAVKAQAARTNKTKKTKKKSGPTKAVNKKVPAKAAKKRAGTKTSVKKQTTARTRVPKRAAKKKKARKK